MPNTTYPKEPPKGGGKWEKMSKSRGNGVSVDEVINGVSRVAPGHYFCDPAGYIIDWSAWCVWKDIEGNNCYYTAKRYGKMPVFLHNESGRLMFDHGNGPEFQHGEEYYE